MIKPETNETCEEECTVDMEINNIIHGLRRGKTISEEDLKFLVYEVRYVAQIEGEYHRWHRETINVIKCGDEYWAVEWGNPITEMSDPEFYSQPYRVEPVDEVKTVRSWKKIEHTREELLVLWKEIEWDKLDVSEMEEKIRFGLENGFEFDDYALRNIVDKYPAVDEVYGKTNKVIISVKGEYWAIDWEEDTCDTMYNTQPYRVHSELKTIRNWVKDE